MVAESPCFLDLDDCIGCYGCEAACRETHRYPYHEDWLKVIRREPFLVDGELRQYHEVAPVLDKCKTCYEADPNPLCVTGCAAQCLKIGPFAEIVKGRRAADRAIYTA